MPNVNVSTKEYLEFLEWKKNKIFFEAQEEIKRLEAHMTQVKENAVRPGVASDHAYAEIEVEGSSINGGILATVEHKMNLKSWREMISEILKKNNRPLTSGELVDQAIKHFGVDKTVAQKSISSNLSIHSKPGGRYTKKVVDGKNNYILNKN